MTVEAPTLGGYRCATPVHGAGIAAREVGPGAAPVRLTPLHSPPAHSARDTASDRSYPARMLKILGDPLVQAALGCIIITLLGALTLKLLIP